MMSTKGRTLARVTVMGAATLLSLYCRDAQGPERQVSSPLGDVAATSDPIRLDQWNGTMGESGTFLIKGFNPTNPHVGDAIVATFFWFGAPGGVTGNIITSVTDVLTTAPTFTPVGNDYELVEFVSDGMISMATYLATNVQGFPDAGTDPNMILAVRADLRVPVTDGGLLISAWTGVAATRAQALGEHRSASGMASLLVTPTIADPGPITLSPGALAYGVSLVNPPASVGGPPGWTKIATQGDLIMNSDGEYDARFTVSPTGGVTDPQWSWFFTGPGTWLASDLALNPAPAAPTTGNLTVTTTTSGENLPTTNYTVTVDGSVSQSIATNGTVTFSALAPGTHTVTLSALPANCEVTSGNPVDVTVVAGETATVTFTVSCSAPPPPPPPPPPPNDFMTGGGKLGTGRDFATFGLEARASGGNFQWVQHCPDGPNPTSPRCARGQFTFHGTVTPGTYAETSRGPNCRTWSGTGTSKETGATNFTVRQACDDGTPGRGVDYIAVTIDGYERSGYLSGGNIQLHGRKS